MKGRLLALSCILGLVIPCIFCAVAENIQIRTAEISKETVPAIAETIQQIQPKETIYIPVLLEQDVPVEMELESYITGVVLGEMPAEFEPEALKAQAIAARTFALKRNTLQQKHENGAVCGDASCCQAYCSQDAYLAAGHEESQLMKIASAVETTAGMVLTYDGVLIEATYFSSSGGRTEDAAAVWGSDVPYLQSVESPGEEQAHHYIDTVRFTADEFQRYLNMDLPGLPETWFGLVTYTDGGGVASMKIGDTVFSGTELRKLLCLRSTAFTMTAIGDTITVTTKGFGHRVGMSQYGADAMALLGSSCEEILYHYYPGTTIEIWHG